MFLGIGTVPGRGDEIRLTRTAGRGRLERAWVAPAGTGLAVSVLVRAEAPGLGWLPLAAASTTPAKIAVRHLCSLRATMPSASAQKATARPKSSAR